MRWCRFRADNKTSFGLVEGDEVVRIAGSPFGAHRRMEERYPLSHVKLLVPCIPPTFYAAGLNYTAHLQVAAAASGGQMNIPDKPDVGYRANNALIAHDEPIVIPKDATEKVQYEGELVVVIGKRAKHLSEEEALNCVLGYTIGNDVSERTWQRGDRTMWRSKNTDTFKPMGPWIDTDAKLEEMRTTVRLNGKVVSEFDTNHMLFGVAKYISTMSHNLTLYPGDVLWMGTDGATENMKPGDVVEVEIRGIGVLRNPVVAEK